MFPETGPVWPRLPERDEKPGKNALRYIKKKKLGKGSFGTVWRILDTKTGRSLAMKVIPIWKKDKEAFRELQDAIREYEVLKNLRHHNIVRVEGAMLCDGGKDMAEIVIFLELVTGNSLDNYLERKGGRISEADLAIFSRQVFSALVFMERNNVIHRDIKPANVLVTADKQIKISDFGTARVVKDPKVTRQMSSRGSPAFIAPEAFKQRFTSSVDVYAWGMSMIVLMGTDPWGHCMDIMDLWQQLTEYGTEENPTNAGPTLPDRRYLSPNAMDLITQCVAGLARKRPTAEQALAHPWLVDAPPFVPDAAREDPPGVFDMDEVLSVLADGEDGGSVDGALAALSRRAEGECKEDEIRI